MPGTSRLVAIVLLAALVVAAAVRGDDRPLRGEVGRITDTRLGEISGLAVSPVHPDVLWVINDSGNAPHLHAVDRAGRHLATVPVRGVRNRDWEDLAAYREGDEGRLVIADVGDNASRFQYVTLYVVPEPDPQAPAMVTVERMVHFFYPDGARDAEGIAIDETAREVLVLSKRTTPPELFAVPLDAVTARPAEAVAARRVGPITKIPPPTTLDVAADPVTGIYSSQPTALDWSAEHGLLVLTYARPYLFRREADEPLVDVIARMPLALNAPRLRQAEALAFDGAAILLTTEGLPAPVLRLALPET